MVSSSASPPPSKWQKKDGKGDGSPLPLVVFAHGAGAPSSSEWMIRWKKMLQEELGAIDVITFDYPYISGGKRRPPPKAEMLVEYHSTIVEDAIVKYSGHPLILVGKSMGSRVSCMVAAEASFDISAVICLGYPLKGVKGALHDETLLNLRTPIMFVQGSNDGLCPLEKLKSTQKKMKAPNGVHVIHGGDHSFKIGKKHLLSTETTQAEAEEQALKAIHSFLSTYVSGLI